MVWPTKSPNNWRVVWYVRGRWWWWPRVLALTRDEHNAALPQVKHVGPRLSAVAAVCVPVCIDEMHWVGLVLDPAAMEIRVIDSSPGSPSVGEACAVVTR